jgi:hypothetical protein
MGYKHFLMAILKIWLFLFLAFLIPLQTNAQIVSPRISIKSSNDSNGILININAIGFSPGSSATIYIRSPDGSQSGIQNTAISPNGTFNSSHLFPIGYPSGNYLLWAVDDSTGKHSNRVRFRIPTFQTMGPETSSSQTISISAPSYTPNHGDLVRAKGDTKIYFIEGQQVGSQIIYQRRGIGSEKVFNQMGFRREDIKEIEPADLMNIAEGRPIWTKELITKFPEGTLIRAEGKTQIYVIQGGRKCYIPDSETFHSKGYSWDQVKEVDQEILDSIITGIPIPSIKSPIQYGSTVTPTWGQPTPSTSTSSPYSQTPSTTYTQPSSTYQPSVGSSTTSISPDTTQTQQQSTFFPDGTLIKGSSPYIYLIENGVRRLIPDMETFNAMGFNWNNIINIDDQRLVSIPIGIPIPKKSK